MTAGDPKRHFSLYLHLLRSMQRCNIFKSLAFLILLAPTLLGCEVKTLYEVRLSGLSEANTAKEYRRNIFTLHVLPSPGTENVGLTLIAPAEPRPDPDWTWNEFGNWPQTRRAAAFSDWFDRVYLDISASGTQRCPLRIQQFDHRETAQDAFYGSWLNNLEPLHKFAEGSKGAFVELPVEQCYSTTDPAHTNQAWLVAAVRDGNGKLLDTVRIEYRIEARESFVEWWIF